MNFQRIQRSAAARASLFAGCVALFSACGSGDAPDAQIEADSAAAAASTAAPQGSTLESADYIGLEDGNIAFYLHWVGGPIAKDATPGAAAPTLESVRTVAGGSFDRVEFKFAGTALPGYELTWATEPTESCSGGSQPPAGARHLRLQLSPATAGGSVKPTVATGHANLVGAAQTCSRNDQLEWQLAVKDSSQIRVLELREPPRLVVDVREGPRVVR